MRKTDYYKMYEKLFRIMGDLIPLRADCGLHIFASVVAFFAIKQAFWQMLFKKTIFLRLFLAK